MGIGGIEKKSQRGIARRQFRRTGVIEMNGDMGLQASSSEDLRETARELIRRHGEHAPQYVQARIEAAQTAGESADAEAWRQVLALLA